MKDETYKKSKILKCYNSCQIILSLVAAKIDKSASLTGKNCLAASDFSGSRNADS